MTERLLLTTPVDPKLISLILNETEDLVQKVTLISVDFPPIEVYNGKGIKNKNQTVFGKKQDQAVMFDVVGLIVDIKINKPQMNVMNNTATTMINNDDLTKKVFIMAHEVMYISSGGEKLISINGNFDILPDELLSKVYTNFTSLKSINLSELEEILELSRDETAIKSFYKLGSYFTAKKYEINNNIFNLIEHQEKAELVAKKVLLKKMVAWEIRK